MTGTRRPFPPRILLHPANRMGASSIYRIGAPADALRRTGFATTLVDQRMPSEETIAVLKPDAIVLQHFFVDEQLEALKRYKRTGVRLVYEIDDLFWALDDENPNKAMIPEDARARIHKALRMCDHAVASTDEMARRLHKDMDWPTSKISVVRNALPQAFVTAAMDARSKTPARQPGEKPRVGWAGGISHPLDLAILEEVVPLTAHLVTWVLMSGWCPESLRHLVEFHEPVPFAHYASMLGSLGLDLAVAPLADTPFNRCKSDLRVLEYAACGYPVLTSRNEVFHDTSIIVRQTNNSPAAWMEAIGDMLADPEALAAHAEALHGWVKEKRLIESRENLVAWTSAWSGIPADSLFVPGAAASAMNIVIVGEPIEYGIKPAALWPCFKTIAEARITCPESSVLYVRPGTVPTHEQVNLLLADHDQFQPASLSAFSNDGDYPVSGRFMPLAGTAMRDMVDAAMLGEQPPVPTPYPTGPVAFLDARALSLVGLPDEARYGDIETALMDWGARAALLGCVHSVDPCVFVPVHATRQLDKNALRQSLMEMGTWHPFLQAMQEKAASDDSLAPARRDMDMAYARIAYAAPSASTYAEWQAMHDDAWTPTVQEWAKNELLAGYGDGSWPLVSIVMPVYNTPPSMLRAAIESVLAQAYDNWELIIVDDASNALDMEWFDAVRTKFSGRTVVLRRAENGHICRASNDGIAAANGKWVLFLDHDDVLAPHALLSLMLEARANPAARFVYADSDLIAPDGTPHSPDFKPDFDYDLLLGQNYVCHPACYRLADVQALDGLRVGFEGSQDYDLILRLIELLRGEGVDLRDAMRHVPLVLYHWRQAPGSVSLDIGNKRYALEAAERAVVEHLHRSGTPAFVGRHPGAPLHHLVRFLPPSPAPKATIVILSQFDGKMLDACLKAILTRTGYPNFSVVVRQVGDDRDVARVAAAHAKADDRVRHVTGGGDSPFNFALLCNACVKAHAHGADVVVLMNDDVQVLEPAWLHDMVGAALRPDVGAVGIKLIYPDGRVQHDGIILSDEAPPGEAALHAFQGMHHAEGGPFGRAAIARRCVAVTAACMAIRREAWESVGGMDAAAFPLDFNDVDLCLRLRAAGLDNVVLSHVTAVHQEGATKRRRPDMMSRSGMLAAEARLLATGLVADPFANPNLAHAPGMASIAACPPRPWRVPPAARTLVVGGDKDDALRAFAGGELPIVAALFGTTMRMVEPACMHAAEVDLNDDDAVDAFLRGYGVGRVLVRRLGKGSTDALGAFVRMAADGMPLSFLGDGLEAVCPRGDCVNDEGPCGHKWKEPPIACQECVDRCGSKHGHVSIAAWRSAWSRFASALTPMDAPAIADDNTSVAKSA